MALTDLTHQLIEKHFRGKPKRLAIDATCGNGYDTEFLCAEGFSNVIGFDIQARAIAATQYRLESAGFENVQLYERSHSDMAHIVKNLTNLPAGVGQGADCIMFNFGYLPHGDKALTTQADTSIDAVEQSLHLLNTGGLLSMICYPGHEQGAVETKAIEGFLASMPENFNVQQHLSSPEKVSAPRLYLVIA